MFVASGFFTASYLQHTPPAQVATEHTPTQQSAAVAATLQFAPVPDEAFASISLIGKAAYVMDITDGRVLYQLNPDAQLSLASITKVPMALAVAEVLASDMQIVIPEDTATPGRDERLAQGDVWYAGDVIDLTLTASSNGGAEVLAKIADEPLRMKYPQAPRGQATLWRMNDLARQLGLTKTYFLNVSGLDESTTQSGAFGSAHDVAILFSYASMHFHDVFSATTKPSFSLTSINGATAYVVNTDRALDAIPGIIMGKTGYTDLAGGNLAVVFDAAPNHPVVAVVLGSTEQGRFEDIKKLVNAARESTH